MLEFFVGVVCGIVMVIVITACVFDSSSHIPYHLPNYDDMEATEFSYDLSGSGGYQ